MNKWEKVSVVLVIVAMAIFLYTTPTLSQQSQNVVTIQAANPYRFDVKLELKCDWNGHGQYRLHQFIVVPGKKQTLIKVPNTLKFCEIWPFVVW